MWEKFNIKTFPAETIVFQDGCFCPELSTLKSTNIEKKYKLPIHIIYVGEIENQNNLDINISAENQKVFMSLRIKNKKPAFLNVFIKNTGRFSEFLGQIMIENNSNIDFNCTATHSQSDTTVFLNTKLLANKHSISKLSGTAIIDKNCINTKSNITFSALADKTAKLEFTPAQKISSIPDTADHSASIFKPTDVQIQYLRESGLSQKEAINVMKESFLNDFSLF